MEVIGVLPMWGIQRLMGAWSRGFWDGWGMVVCASQMCADLGVRRTGFKLV